MNALRRTIAALLAVSGLLLAGCAQTTSPAGWPANLRWDLVPRWIAWTDNTPAIAWPPNDGCAATPVAETLPVNTVIDRFGSENGTFFSPKGESFKARAVPYVCSAMDYRVYRVLRPLPVRSCKAAAWFNEPGGATQVQTAEPAAKLVAAHTIEGVEFDGAANGRSAPICGKP